MPAIPVNYTEIHHFQGHDRAPKVRDRGDVGAEEKIRFTSSILPK
jgi:hypothetical protein